MCPVARFESVHGCLGNLGEMIYSRTCHVELHCHAMLTPNTEFGANVPLDLSSIAMRKDGVSI